MNLSAKEKADIIQAIQDNQPISKEYIYKMYDGRKVDWGYVEWGVAGFREIGLA